MIDPEDDIGAEQGEGAESQDFQAELEAERIAEEPDTDAASSR